MKDHNDNPPLMILRTSIHHPKDYPYNKKSSNLGDYCFEASTLMIVIQML
jgi:hypothetical protein